MRAIIRLMKKRRSGGFTLVEMMVSVALIGILLGGMMLLIGPIVRSYQNENAENTAQNTTTCVQEYISRTIRNSYRVAIFENTNYSAISSNTAYKNAIKSMNDFCASVNGTSATKTYLLKCLSLKYDTEDNKYYLYNESVDMAANGDLDSSKAEKVFADCLYNELYTTYSFSKAKNGDYVEGGTKPEFREDALQMDFNTYRDIGYSSPVFSGSGITEMRQIKVMLADDETSKDKYNVKVEPADPKEFDEMTDGSRDIYIYYIARRVG